MHGATSSNTDLTMCNVILHITSTLLFAFTSTGCTLISQTFKEDKLIHKDSRLTRQLAYLRVKVIYISLSEYETMMATSP